LDVDGRKDQRSTPLSATILTAQFLTVWMDACFGLVLAEEVIQEQKREAIRHQVDGPRLQQTREIVGTVGRKTDVFVLFAETPLPNTFAKSEGSL
jgi:hypothetical protein